MTTKYDDRIHVGNSEIDRNTHNIVHRHIEMASGLKSFFCLHLSTSSSSGSVLPGPGGHWGTPSQTRSGWRHLEEEEQLKYFLFSQAVQPYPGSKQESWQL